MGRASTPQRQPKEGHYPLVQIPHPHFHHAIINHFFRLWRIMIRKTLFPKIFTIFTRNMQYFTVFFQNIGFFVKRVLNLIHKKYTILPTFLHISIYYVSSKPPQSMVFWIFFQKQKTLKIKIYMQTDARRARAARGAARGPERFKGKMCFFLN